jgi:tRNA (guanine37-N1)-methyltransferase
VYTIYILGLFPKEAAQFFLKGIFKRAQDEGIINVSFIDIREFSVGKHQKVDEYPFGHKTGMLLRADVLYNAITSIPSYANYHLIYTCPKGPVLTQKVATTLTKKQGLIIIPGYYKGIDERLFSLLPIPRISLGDFVVSSGEIPAFAIAESVIRLLPGVIGNTKSMTNDSIMKGCLEAPHYTQPREWMGQSVPEIMISGNHPEIKKWERKKALQQTLFWKPELLLETSITKEDQKHLQYIILNGET